MGKTVNIKDLREKGDIVLVVFKEHTLGYINLERPGTLAVLRACVWKGADWSSSPTVPLPPAEYKVRIAEIFTKIRKSVNASSSMLANLWYFNGNRICTVSCNHAGW